MIALCLHRYFGKGSSVHTVYWLLFLPC